MKDKKYVSLCVIKGDQLANIEKQTLHNFVKLRTDYRQQNLSRLFT